MMPSAPSAWSHSEGYAPYTVTAYERVTRKGVVYLRWRIRGAKGPNWENESLGFAVRTARGKLEKEAVAKAVAAARAKHHALVTGRPSAAPAGPLTLAQGLVLALDVDAGKYAAKGQHQREVILAVEYAIAKLGADRLWSSIGLNELRVLWRHRMRELGAKGKAGYRGAEVTVVRLLSVAAWLRDEVRRLAPGDCLPPKKWRLEMARDWRTARGATADYEPARPRHTIAELRRLLAAAAEVDPRFALLVQLGAELRLGQVVRARRSWLDLDRGALVLRSVGKKRAPAVLLTAGQLAAARAALAGDGYLAPLEAAGGDYPLFPSGKLSKGQAIERHREAKPVHRRTVGTWWAAAEAAAKIPHQVGRGAYGGRRVSVDEAKARGISREGLMAAGGWTDSQVPDQIYADQDAEYARAEARRVRANVRGEGPDA